MAPIDHRGLFGCLLAPLIYAFGFGDMPGSAQGSLLVGISGYQYVIPGIEPGHV